MRAALTSIGVATLVAVSAAWPQAPPADAPVRVPPGPLRTTPDVDVARLLRYEPTGLSLLHPYRRGRVPVVFVHGLWSGPWSWSPMVIADRRDPPRTGGGDGLVSYASAHLDGVASELLVSSGHLCQGHPAVFGEVRRILAEHAVRSLPGRPPAGGVP